VLAIESFDYASAQAEAAPLEAPAEKVDLVLEAEPVLVEDSVIVRPEGATVPVGETIEVVEEPVPVENNVLKFH
jgi:hypothetical protein